VPLSELSLEVTDHDRERAEDTVAELERLGVYRESGVSSVPAEGEPAPAPESTPSEAPSSDATPSEQRRQQVTDLWGNPLASRRLRRRKS
jgi:hypothetical protein